MQRGLARAVGFREDFLEEAEAINLDSKGPLASDSGGGILGRSNRMPKKQSYHKQTVCIKSRYFLVEKQEIGLKKAEGVQSLWNLTRR